MRWSEIQTSGYGCFTNPLTRHEWEHIWTISMAQKRRRTSDHRIKSSRYEGCKMGFYGQIPTSKNVYKFNIQSEDIITSNTHRKTISTNLCNWRQTPFMEKLPMSPSGFRVALHPACTNCQQLLGSCSPCQLYQGCPQFPQGLRMWSGAFKSPQCPCLAVQTLETQLRTFCFVSLGNSFIFI